MSKNSENVRDQTVVEIPPLIVNPSYFVDQIYNLGKIDDELAEVLRKYISDLRAQPVREGARFQVGDVNHCVGVHHQKGNNYACEKFAGPTTRESARKKANKNDNNEETSSTLSAKELARIQVECGLYDALGGYVCRDHFKHLINPDTVQFTLWNLGATTMTTTTTTTVLDLKVPGPNVSEARKKKLEEFLNQRKTYHENYNVSKSRAKSDATSGDGDSGNKTKTKTKVKVPNNIKSTATSSKQSVLGKDVVYDDDDVDF
jgi:hypothetical protein